MGRVSLKRPRPGTRSLFAWVFGACFLGSLLVHLLFLGESKTWIIAGFSSGSYDTIIPRTFRMKRVEIDPKLLSDSEPNKEKKEQHVDVVLSQDHPVTDGKTSNQEKTLPMQRPKEILTEEGLGLHSLEKGDKLPGTEALTDTALPNTVPLSSSMLDPGKPTDQNLLLTPREGGIGGTEEKVGRQSGGGVGTNFSNIDDLLAGTGSLSQKTAPILMPTDLLFEYDSDILRKEASEALLKLGSLIRKNAQASFRIEGHTDSFGSESYNDHLSLRRAEAVRNWLLQNAGLDARQITTAGLGKRHLLAPSTASVTEQQINRRVEIVITTH